VTVVGIASGIGVVVAPVGVFDGALRLRAGIFRIKDNCCCVSGVALVTRRESLFIDPRLTLLCRALLQGGRAPRSSHPQFAICTTSFYLYC
jgi:hypothetical protein